MRNNRRTIILLLFAALALTAACKNQEAFKLATPAAPSSAASAAAEPSVEHNSYADVVGRVAPAVVTIRSERVVRAPQQHPFADDPSFRDFFGEGAQPQAQPRPQVQRGLGSGVVISPDGFILTNHHVVDGAEEIKVELTDKRILDAKVIGSDQLSDLAVLKVDAGNLPVLTLGDSDKVRVGDIVLAVGNPLNVGQTVTMGIISAKGRQSGLSDGSFEDFLQTDAPINQGNSGGALVNTNGELVGINSQILSTSGGNIGIGFAIPSNMARTVSEQLINKGKVRRGQLGVVVQAVTADIAASIGQKESRGVIVSSVQAGSAAADAGIKQGDVITAVNGNAVNEPNVLRNQIAGTEPGTEVTLTIARDGHEQQIKAKIGELVSKGAKSDEQDANGNGEADTGKLGLGLEPLTPDLAARLGLPETAQGLVITSVAPASAAEEAGLRQGDVIEQANREAVRTVEDMRGAIKAAGERPLLLLVNRRGQSVFVTVQARK